MVLEHWSWLMRWFQCHTLPSGECSLTVQTAIASIAGMQLRMAIPRSFVLEQSGTVLTFEWHMLRVALGARK